MARNKWTLSYIVLVISSVLLLVFYPAIPTFAASRSLYGNSADSRLNHADTLTPTYGTATISPTSLNGLDQTLTVTIPVEVVISNGTTWHMQIGLTPLASTNYTLPTSLNVGLIGLCNDISSCRWHIFSSSYCTGIVVGFPYRAISSITSITASGSTPSPVTVYDDSVGCTTGTITFTTTLTATLLARNTYAGTYTSEIQANVIAGP